VIADDSEQVEELASVRELKNLSEESGIVSLEECFKVDLVKIFILFKNVNYLKITAVYTR